VKSADKPDAESSSSSGGRGRSSSRVRGERDRSTSRVRKASAKIGSGGSGGGGGGGGSAATPASPEKSSLGPATARDANDIKSRSGSRKGRSDKTSSRPSDPLSGAGHSMKSRSDDMDEESSHSTASKRDKKSRRGDMDSSSHSTANRRDSAPSVPSRVGGSAAVVAPAAVAAPPSSSSRRRGGTKTSTTSSSTKDLANSGHSQGRRVRRSKARGGRSRTDLEKGNATPTASTSRAAAAKAASRAMVSRSASFQGSKRDEKAITAFSRRTRAKLVMERERINQKIELVDKLSQMSKSEKTKYLFSLIDRDGGGTVDPEELAAALRKRNEELTFGYCLDKAVAMVAAFDDDGNAELDVDEFAKLLDAMTSEMGLDFHEFSEFLAFQLRYSEVDEEDLEEQAAPTKKELAEQVHKHRELLSLLADPQLKELYQLFDTDGSGDLDFKEVAVGLYQMTLDMERVTQTAMQVLLMLDNNDTRTLNFEQFGKLIMAFLASTGKSFSAVAGELTAAMEKNRGAVKDKDLALLGLLVGEPALDEFDFDSCGSSLEEKKDDGVKRAGKTGASKKGPENSEMDALTVGRLNKLFDLWDADSSGDLSIEEITAGLRKYQQAASGTKVSVDAEKEAQNLLGFDTSGFQKLGRKEFAKGMFHFSRENNVAIHDLIDASVMIFVLGNDDDAFECQKAFNESFALRPVKVENTQSEQKRGVQRTVSDDFFLFE